MADERLYDYWGPKGFLLDFPASPGPDYYRLVNEDAEAEEAISVGEPPLRGHRGMRMAELEQQRVLQWEGPNRIFTRDQAGRPMVFDIEPDEEAIEADAGRVFAPLWNSEGYPHGSPENRARLTDHLRRAAPDLLERPAGGFGDEPKHEPELRDFGQETRVGPVLPELAANGRARRPGSVHPDDPVTESVLAKYFTPVEREYLAALQHPPRVAYAWTLGPPGGEAHWNVEERPLGLKNGDDEPAGWERQAHPTAAVWGPRRLWPQIAAHELDHALALSTLPGLLPGTTKSMSDRVERAMSDPDFARRAKDSHQNIRPKIGPAMNSVYAGDPDISAPLLEYLARLRETRQPWSWWAEWEKPPMGTREDPGLGKSLSDLLESSALYLRHGP